MSALKKGTLFITPWMQCRHGGKINIKNPRPGPLDRRVFEAVTAQIMAPSLTDNYKHCSVMNEHVKKARVEEQQEENLYKQFIVRQCRKFFDQSNMILVFHYMSIKYNDHKEIWYKFYEKDLDFKVFGREVVRLAVQDTKWVNMDPLFNGRNVYVFGNEPKVEQAINIANHIPELVLLGGVVDNAILTKAGLTRYAALPKIDHLQGQLVGVLNSAAGKTRTLLSQHQQLLSANLEQYVKDQTGQQDS